MAEEKDVEFISSHKYMKNTSTCGTIFTEFLLNAGRDLIMPKLREKNHHITRTIKEKTEIRMGPASLGGSCEKVPSNWETFTSAGRSVRTEKELQRIRGEQSTQLLAVRTERPAQRVLATFLHSLDTGLLVCLEQLSAEIQASEDRPRQRTAVGYAETT